MINVVFSMAHIYPPGASKWLLWLHLAKWAFLSYQHNAELSTVNFDHFGVPRRYGMSGAHAVHNEGVNGTICGNFIHSTYHVNTITY